MASRRRRKAGGLYRLARLLDALRTSLWFIPAVMSAGAISLALVLTRLDWTLQAEQDLWWLHSGGAGDARELLGTLISSLFTMTTLMISITMVVLTLAANQLGPRLIRSFMGDRKTQIALGLFAATIVYSLLVLRSLNAAPEITAVPHLAITTAGALSLLGIFTLFFFVHHLARSIVADAVVQRVGDALDASIPQLLPDPDGSRAPATVMTPSSFASFRLQRGGYVQAIDFERLIACARDANAMVALDFRAGHHVLPGSAEFRISPSEALTPGLKEECEEAILIGKDRTPTQDIEFAMRQLTEIALRALSPGVNDPFTAIAVIDRLARSITLVMAQGEEEAVRCDEDGIARIVVPVSTFEGILDVCFNQIRQVSADKPDILIRLLEVICALLRTRPDPKRRAALLVHARMLAEAGRRNIDEPRDRASVEDRYGAILSEAGES